MTWDLAIKLILGLLATGGTSYGIWVNRKKRDAEAESVAVGSLRDALEAVKAQREHDVQIYRGMVNDLSEQLERVKKAEEEEREALEAKIVRLEEARDTLQRRVSDLEQRLRTAEATA